MKPRSSSKPPAAVAATVEAAAHLIGSIGSAISTSLLRPRLNPPANPEPRPGSAPGIESAPDIDTPPAKGTVRIRVVELSLERVQSSDVESCDVLFNSTRPEWSKVRWIQVCGLHPYVVNRIREHFDIHTLAAEDVLRPSQRPKVDVYDNCLFIVQRMLMLRDQHLHNEQVSFFLFKGLLVTFQESEADVWDPVRTRLEKPESRLRRNDASYLFYALLDAVVDHCFPIIECYGDQLDVLEEEILKDPSPRLQRRIHQIKRDLAVLRRMTWPTREIVNFLERGESPLVSRVTRTYLRDVLDHTVQAMEVVEMYREMAGGLNDLYMSSVSNRMNEIMKVLTVMATLFIPITFLAGVYGTNFAYFPELAWKYSYLVFWMVCIGTVTSLLIYFRRKGWIGRR